MTPKQQDPTPSHPFISVDTHKKETGQPHNAHANTWLALLMNSGFLCIVICLCSGPVPTRNCIYKILVSEYLTAFAQPRG